MLCLYYTYIIPNYIDCAYLTEFAWAVTALLALFHSHLLFISSTSFVWSKVSVGRRTFNTETDIYAVDINASMTNSFRIFFLILYQLQLHRKRNDVVRHYDQNYNGRLKPSKLKRLYM